MALSQQQLFTALAEKILNPEAQKAKEDDGSANQPGGGAVAQQWER